MINYPLNRNEDCKDMGEIRGLSRRFLREFQDDNAFSNSSTISAELELIKSFVRTISFPNSKTNLPLTSTPKTEEVSKIEEELLTYVMESRGNTKLFGDVEYICKINNCTQAVTEEMIKCSGTCNGYVHRKCFENRFPHHLAGRDNEGEPKGVLCDECNDQSKPLCFICKHEDSSEPIKCCVENCRRHYHAHCLNDWPQTKFIESNSRVVCPSHNCHNCAPGDSKNKDCSITGFELTNCIKCPTTLHASSCCINAGTTILTDKHQRLMSRKVCNINYCYICNAGKFM